MRHMDCVSSFKPALAGFFCSKLRLTAFTCGAAICALLSSHAYADSRFAQLPSISAEHLTLSNDGAEVIARSIVQLSSSGMKVFDFGDGHSAEIIQNFDDDRTWLINRNEKVVYELPMSDDSIENSEHASVHGMSVEDFDSREGSSVRQLGLLAGEPCVGLVAEKAGFKVWRGQRIEVWNCLQAKKLISKQYFSPEWRIVVREHRIGSSIEELRSLQNVVFPTKYFNPKNNFRSADLRELLLGSPEISSFSE